MPREPLASQSSARPVSRLSLLALGLTLVAVALAVLSGFGHRWGWWHFSTGFQVLRWGVYLAAGAFLLAVIAIVIGGIRRRSRDIPPAFIALVVSAGVVIVPAQWLSSARSVPPIHDITTDVVDPPAFEAILPLRRNAPNPPEYAGPAVAEQQRAAYPDIVPFTIERPAEEVFNDALDAARALGWNVIAADQATGRIEAVDTTFWFGFKDDVVMRIRETDGVTRVDVRSKSRVGRSDVGTNAERIRALIDRLGG